MLRFFTRQRFGRPQVLAACLLLAFLAQCLWLVSEGARPETVDLAEIYRLEQGTALWTGAGSAIDANLRAVAGLQKFDREDESSTTEADLWPAAGSGAYDANHSPSVVSDRGRAPGDESAFAAA